MNFVNLGKTFVTVSASITSTWRAIRKLERNDHYKSKMAHDTPLLALNKYLQI